MGITPIANAAAGQGTPAVTGFDDAAVQSQLGRILASPHFRNSKRSQALLRFVVQATLAADANSLKERCIGASVFGREATYDTAQDPIVRNAAIEVRKRLAQYYLEPEHACELRIDLPIGSYQPVITPQAPLPAPAAARAQAAIAVAPARGVSRRTIAAMLAATVALVGAAVAWSARRTPAAELEAFWAPLFREGKTIRICIGQPTRLYRFVGPRIEELNQVLGTSSPAAKDTRDFTIAPDELTWVAPEYLFLRDSLSAFKIGSWLQAKGRAHQLMSVSQTNYSQLRHAPMVSIGAFNNPWAMRVTSEQRFVFERRTVDGSGANCIIDRRSPDTPRWSVTQPEGPSMTEDFAIVTRVFDPATETTVISVAGIQTFGTLAASEFVTEPQYLGEALRAAGKDWRPKNVQFVLGTRIIDGTPGPPRVLASHFW